MDYYDLITNSLICNLNLFSFILSKKISLIGSRFMSSNSTYKTYLLTHGLDNGTAISLEFGPKTGNKYILNDTNQSLFKEFEFNVSIKD